MMMTFLGAPTALAQSSAQAKGKASQAVRAGDRI